MKTKSKTIRQPKPVMPTAPAFKIPQSLLDQVNALTTTRGEYAEFMRKAIIEKLERMQKDTQS